MDYIRSAASIDARLSNPSLAALTGGDKAVMSRLAELEEALREDHDTFAAICNQYPFTQGDPLAKWRDAMVARIDAIKALVGKPD